MQSSLRLIRPTAIVLFIALSMLLARSVATQTGAVQAQTEAATVRQDGIQGVIDGTHQSMLVQLVDATGSIVDQTISAPDGAFVFPTAHRDAVGIQVAQPGEDMPLLSEPTPIDRVLAEQFYVVTLPPAANVAPANVAVEQRSTLLVRGKTTLAQAGLRVELVSEQNEIVGVTFTDPAGAFSFAPIVDNGSYRFALFSAENTQLALIDRTRVNAHTAQNSFLLRPAADSTGNVLTQEQALITGNRQPYGVTIQSRGGGTISGQVTSLIDGSPLENVSAIAWTGEFNWYASASTDSNGNFMITGLEDGNYRVSFDPYFDNRFLIQWYENASSYDDATTLTISDGNAITDIDAQLHKGAAVTGVVTSGDTGAPLVGTYVEVLSDRGWQIASASTDSNGRYTIGRILPNSYLRFTPLTSSPYVGEYFDNAYSFDQATELDATPATTTTINAVLEVGGSISGRVTDASTGQPLATGYVQIQTLSQSGNFYETIAQTPVESDGTYTLNALQPRDYIVYFTDTVWNSGRLSEFYDSVYEAQDATMVSVTLGETVSNIDASLDRAGVVEGTVTDASGAPLEGVYVRGFDANGIILNSSASTDVDGNYSLGELPDGPTRIRFTAPYDSGLLDEYYDDATSLAGATPLPVVQNTVINDIDAVLEPGGTISGRVTGLDTGDGLDSVQVQALRDDGSGFLSGLSTMTDSDGNYEIIGLVDDAWLVEFSTFSSSRYLGQYYDGQDSADSADLVTTVAGTTVSGIDAVLDLGGIITGTIANAIPDPWGGPSVGIRIFDSSGQDIGYESEFLGANDSYEIDGLADGDYYLQFIPTSDAMQDAGYVSEFYNDKRNLASADLVTATRNQITPNIDVAFNVGGSISGTVIGADTNAGLGDVEVRAYNVTIQQEFYIRTDVDGQYTLIGLPEGDYRLQFEPYPWDPDPYLPIYYNQKENANEADLVSVAIEQTVTGINATLNKGGIVTGRVVADDTGDPIVNARIRATNLTGSGGQSVSTDSNGDYLITGLPTGDYRIEFDPTNSYQQATDYVREYYDDQLNPVDATPVQVTVNQTTSGIDAGLARGGIIRGQVTAADTGLPLADVRVTLDGSSQYDEVTTGTNGMYEFRGVEPVPTYICMNPEYSSGETVNYLRRCLSEPLTVGLGETVADADIALPRGAVLEGRVTSAETGDPIPNMEVQLVTPNDALIRGTSTDSDGNYRITRIDHMTTTVRVKDFANNSGNGPLYPTTYYDNQYSLATADLLAFGHGTTTTVDFALQIGGALEGQLTKADGSPFSDEIRVDVLNADPSTYLRTVQTNDDGHYRIQGLASGNYRLNFSQATGLRTHVREYYEESPIVEAAAPIAVDFNTTTTINYMMREGATISGIITDAATGAPIEGAFVATSSNRNSCGIITSSGGSDSTDSDGRYTLTGLGEGSYRITASHINYDPDKPSYLTQSASLTISNLGTTYEQDIALTQGGTIEGVVSAEDTGNPLQSVYVALYQERDDGVLQIVYSQFTRADGSFKFNGLSDGTYTVLYNTRHLGSSQSESLVWYISEWSGNQFDFDDAQPVTIAGGNTVTSDAVLSRGGRIAGQVGTESGFSASVFVSLYTPDGQRVNGGNSGYGSYVSHAVPTGQYLVHYDVYDQIDTFYNASGATTIDPSNATVVNVVAGEITADIDMTFENGSAINGQVILGRYGSAGARIAIYDDNGQQVEETYSYNSSNSFLRGIYASNHYPAGTYFVMVHDRMAYGGSNFNCYDGMLRANGAYYGGSAEFSTATPIVLDGTTSAYSIDITTSPDNPPAMPPGQSLQAVTGVVESTARAPLSGARVETDSGFSTLSNLQGEYTLNLPPGTHTITVEHFGSAFTPASQTIVVTNAAVTANFSGTSAGGSGQLVGTVTNAQGGLADATVSLFYKGHSGWIDAGSVQSGANGNFAFGSLVAGEYRVMATDMSNGQPAAYHGGQTMFTHANIVALGDGATAVANIALADASSTLTVDGGNVQFDNGLLNVMVPMNATARAVQLTFTAQASCTTGSPTAVELLIGTERHAMMADSNGYAVTLDFPTNSPSAETHLAVQTTCSDESMSELIGAMMPYEPMGAVRNLVTNAAIEDALVTLYYVAGAQPDANGETLDCRTASTHPAGSGVPYGAWSGLTSAEIDSGTLAHAHMATSNRVAMFSPAGSMQLSGADGSYGWDFTGGCWYVTVRADGYESLTSPLFGGDEAITDLDLLLQPTGVVIYKTYLPMVTRP